MPCLVSPDVTWAEPSSMWSPLYVMECTLWWWCTLLKSACQPLLKSCTFIVLFSSKDDDFCMTLGSATSWPTCSCGRWFTAAFPSTNHRPQIGHQIFVCCRLYYILTPLWKGSSDTGPMTVDRIQTLWTQTFPATENCSRENIYLFIIISNLRNVMVENGNRLPMCMHMSISLKEEDAHAHPIIFYACSAHVQCQGPGSDMSKLLDKS